jgi:glycosyltransferase involved in cell wall biosynthesis
MQFLEENGFDYKYSFLLSASDDKVFYKPGKYLHKLLIFLKSLIKRLRDVIVSNQYDIVFIQREAFMVGTVVFEKLFSYSRAKIIFDFDDSIWLNQVSQSSAPNKGLRFLKKPRKTADIIQLSDLVFAGNPYLAAYAERYNPSVVIVPTTIDTSVYQEDSSQRNSNVITIGWSGSKTTIDHFNLALPALREVEKRYEKKVKIKIIGDGNYNNHELKNYQALDWKGDEEVDQLNSFDIGIMPLPDDEWAKGKCGLKGLQYMALAVPTIMSPVGVNTEIIQHGINGFLASTTDEWITFISQLVEDADLRKRLGQAGKKTVVDHFSVEVWRDRYLQHFRRLLKG